MDLKVLKQIGFIVAFVGLVLLIWANITALLHKPVPIDLTFVNIFFVVFPLWAFTIHYMRKSIPVPDDATIAGMDRFQKIRYLLGNPPNWAMVVLAAIYGYAIYSMYLFITGGSMEPELVNGKYQVSSHGYVKIFTEEEYVNQRFLHVRTITGFFMAFFSVSAVVLAPWQRSAD